MIIDFKADTWHALRHDILCAHTGERIALPIFYADDIEGVVRHYLKDDGGAYLTSLDGSPAFREVRMAIRIVRKSPPEVAAIDEEERQFREGVNELKTLAQTVDDLRYGEAPR